MTTTVIERPLIRRVSWGALFAGFFVGSGVWLMLLLLIAGIGLSAVDPRNLRSWADVVEAIGIWGGVAGIIAMFVGGWCAGRLCGTSERGEGALHGAAVWGLGLAVCTWIAMVAVSTAVSGAAGVAGKAVGAVGSAAAPALGAASQDQLAKAASAAVNGYLQENGRQPLPPEQVQAAARDIGAQAMQRIERGDLSNAVDRQLVVSVLARDTNLSPQDASALADHVSQQVQSALGQAGQSAQGTAQQVGQAAATGGSTAAWGGFVFAVLTLIGAVLGGALAITGSQRRRVAAREEPARTAPLRPQEA